MMAGGGIASRLYRGEVSINFVGRQRLWYALSGVILLVAVIALAVRGLNFSIDFEGGASFTFPVTAGSSAGLIARAVTGAGGGDSVIQNVAHQLTHQWTVQTGTLSASTSQHVTN